MRGKITLVVLAFLALACSKEGPGTDRGLDYSYGRELPHEMIVLGDRLDNPYTTENMTKALQSLYPTKADRVDVKTTHLYVRFLPRTDREVEMLDSLNIVAENLEKCVGDRTLLEELSAFCRNWNTEKVCNVSKVFTSNR